MLLLLLLLLPMKSTIPLVLLLTTPQAYCRVHCSCA
jgi:hypothetical protein